ncbi:hypothetical protein AAY473_017887 [Plecturocebus cupreus]
MHWRFEEKRERRSGPEDWERKRNRICHPGWSAVVQSWLTAAYTFPGSDDPPTSLPKMGFHHVAQAGLELLGSSSPPSLASQSVRDVGHCARLKACFYSCSLTPIQYGVSLCCPGWSAKAQSRLTATSASWVQRFAERMKSHNVRHRRPSAWLLVRKEVMSAVTCGSSRRESFLVPEVEKGFHEEVGGLNIGP